MKDIVFPKDFVWGVATSAYQIEGATKEDLRQESIWDRFCKRKGAIFDASSGETACEHYHKLEEDVSLIKNLGVNSYRFSIAWPRIKNLDFYDRLIDELLKSNIEPWVTLYHWDLPQTLEDLGGWANPDISNFFQDYADTVSRRFGDRVKNWMSINEPWCISMLGYYLGVHAPGRKNLRTALKASHNLNLSHIKAYDVIKLNSPDSQVGIVLNLSPVYPLTLRMDDVQAAQRFDGYLNRWFLDPIFKGWYSEDMVKIYDCYFPKFNPDSLKGIKTDFLGVNYYTPAWVSSSNTNPPLNFKQEDINFLPKTDMGWAIYPRGIFEVLNRVYEEYGVSKIYVTENGAAFKDKLTKGKVKDKERGDFLKDHLFWVLKAKQKGIPVEGYFLWSFLDNFEWQYGFTKRFGVYFTDYKSQKRFIKESGQLFKKIIGNSLS